MGKYSQYKDSGFEWLGAIPSHWKIRKSKYLWTELDGRSIFGSEQLLSVSQYDGVRESSEASRSESLKGYKIVEKDNLVINIMLAWLGGLGISQNDGIVSPAYCVYKLKDKQNPRFLHYLYRTPLYLAEFARHSTGIVPSRWRMYTDDFGQVQTILPPIEEQDAIVAYLDKQTSMIDEAIVQQQQMIDLLNERKQIIIQKAVTQGLATNVQTKDSGLVWLGDIPHSWEVKKLKHIGAISKILIDPRKNQDSTFVEYSMPAYDDNKQPKVVKGEELDSSKILLTEQTLLINKLNVHKQRIWLVEEPEKNAVASTEFVPIQITKAYPKFVEMFLRNHKVTEFLKSNSNGTTNSQKRVSPSDILNLSIALPRLEEQRSIVEYIDKCFIPLDLQIRQLHEKVKLLQERKQIMIHNVVIGKTRV